MEYFVAELPFQHYFLAQRYLCLLAFLNRDWGEEDTVVGCDGHFAVSNLLKLVDVADLIQFAAVYIPQVGNVYEIAIAFILTTEKKSIDFQETSDVGLGLYVSIHWPLDIVFTNLYRRTPAADEDHVVYFHQAFRVLGLNVSSRSHRASFNYFDSMWLCLHKDERSGSIYELWIQIVTDPEASVFGVGECQFVGSYRERNLLRNEIYELSF